jgi:thiamine biosynthesis lipoprotein
MVSIICEFMSSGFHQLQRRLYRFAVFNTFCELTLLVDDFTIADSFACRAADWLRGFEQRYSRFLPTSKVSEINRRAGKTWTPIDAEFSQLLKLAQAAWERTEGALDITSLPLYALWAGERDEPPTDFEITKVLAKVGLPKLLYRDDCVMLSEADMGLDLGGIGKEYAVDYISEMARPESIRGLLVAIGGDLRATGATPVGGWAIGVEHPRIANSPTASLRLRHAAVATSGVMRRGCHHGNTRIAHILDPRTGYPAAGPAAVTVFAESCFEAGIHATAACLKADAATALKWLNERKLRALVAPAGAVVMEGVAL